MLNLKFWLHEQGLGVRGLASQLHVPRKTVEDWVYRGAVPSPVNMVRLNNIMCTHHWVIEAAHGPLSEGVCQHCGGKREFKNSGDVTRPWLVRQQKAQ